MAERFSKQSQTVVFRTSEGRLVWGTLENSEIGAEMIKERESQGDRVVLVTSPEEAKKIIKQQTGQKQEFVLFER